MKAMAILLARTWLVMCLCGICACADTMFSEYNRINTLDNKTCTGPTLMTRETSSYLHCALVCNDEPNCNAIQYNVETRLCTGRQYKLDKSPDCKEQIGNVHYSTTAEDLLSGYSWNEAAHMYYRLYTNKCASWTSGRETCRKDGADLIVLKDQDFAALFRTVMVENVKGQCGAGDGVWVGASYGASEGEWVWVDGDPVDRSIWAPGQPSHGPQENCIDMLFHLGFRGNDAPCSFSGKHFACSKSVVV